MTTAGFIPDIDAMYRDMAEHLGNRVKCGTCGRTQEVDAVHCLRHGWPKCCDATMSIDDASPKEGAAA